MVRIRIRRIVPPRQIDGDIPNGKRPGAEPGMLSRLPAKKAATERRRQYFTGSILTSQSGAFPSSSSAD